MSVDASKMNFDYCTISTKYGKIQNVPLTKFPPLRPYYPDIVRSIFETLLEDNFSPGFVTNENQYGFYAPADRWSQYEADPKHYPLFEPLRFLQKLLRKSEFVTAVRGYNKQAKLDWIKDANIVGLGGFIYGIAFYLAPCLTEKTIEHRIYAKPRIVGPQSRSSKESSRTRDFKVLE